MKRYFESTQACDIPWGFVDNATDCDDTQAAVRPSAQEVCNGIDDDCDGNTDDDPAYLSCPVCSGGHYACGSDGMCSTSTCRSL